MIKKYFKKWIILSMIMLQVSFSLMAQEVTVTGTVTSYDDGEPLPGVSVVIKGTTTGTVTNIDGVYSLKVDQKDILIFSYVGYTSQSVIVGKQTKLDIRLSEDVTQLEEVIAIGFGSQRKKEITGAVTRIESESINEIVSADLGSAIQGRIAGVNVTASSGEPGASANIQIRGITSISGSSAPLYVVDGVPQDSDPRIPNSEIESIDVLKDAASASIYGTRAAAGVILITTKSGKEGKTAVNFDATYGINDITSDIPLMNANEALYFNQIRDKYTAWGGNAIRDPSWLQNDTRVPDMVLNDGAATQTYNLNISGGKQNFSYNASLGYYDQEGILVNSQFKRISSRITTNYNEGRVNIRTSIGFNTEDHDRQGGGLLFWAINYQPYLPELSTESDVIEYADGGSQWQAQALLERLKAINNVKSDRFNGSVDVNIDIIDGLKFRTVVGGSIVNSMDERFTPSWTYYNVETGETEKSDPTSSFSRMRSTRNESWSFSPSLNYNQSFGKHNVTALAAFSLDERSREDFTAEAQGIDDPNLSVLDNGLLAEFAFNGFNYVIRDVGLIGRILYNFDSKYMLSASIRRDASSKFGPTKRWGTFPSVSLGWNVSEENFWSGMSSFANHVKFRASYGTAGNESFSPYSYSATIGEDFDYIFTTSNGVTVGKAQDVFSNADVQWETSIQANIGVDLGFFDNKLSVTADVYNTQKKDMLFPLQLPVSAGIPGGGEVTLNVGDMENKGFEIAANYRMIKRDLNVNFGATYSRNRNKITKIFGDTDGYFNRGGNTVQGDYNNTLASKMQVGYEAGAFFLFETNGVVNTEEELLAYQQIRPTAQMGDLIYVDQLTVDTDGDGIPDQGDGSITSDDQVYSGSGLPDFEIGFNMSAEYKGFDLSMNWYASVGNEVMNGSAVYAYGMGRHADLLNMWTPENSDSELPILRLQNHKDDPNYRGNTDLWIEDGSFVRLKLISLGYTLPTSMVESAGIGSLRLYVSAQNPITFTEYTGYDPEIGGSNIIQRGLDRGAYPVFSQYIFGVQLKF